MQPTQWTIAGAALAGLVIVLLAAAAEPVKLNIKPGLWEIASQNQITGAPPISDDMLARLTPEQRARFEASMQASMANATKPRLAKHCVTPEKIARGLDVEQHNDASCQKKLVSNSTSEMEISEDCNNPKDHTVISEHVQLSGSEQLTGTVHVVKSSGDRTMTVDSTIHGKWLSASCGDVKDFEIEQ
ncbi:MAG TPA: DUF3617 domain-containing protein [Steroidobacteraceae bacterium]|nr:DUF3617 domain-containing protein [Steroidobacteraceae bacterium]